MNIQERISYDSTELLRILYSELEKINAIRLNPNDQLLLGRSLIEKLTQWDLRIHRQTDMPLTIAVCGEFKRGKSSLINALLEEDVVTTNVTTETITVNYISYGDHENLIVLSDGKRIKLSDEELSRDRLREIIAELPEKNVKLHLKRPVELLRSMTIIDTPGLGDSLHDYANDVAVALQNADAVIYVLSTAMPLSVQEQFFIKTAIKPQKYTDLFLIANYSDILKEPEDCERVKATIKKRLSDYLPDEEPIMLSALDERCLQRGEERPNEKLKEYLGDKFKKFRERLMHLSVIKRDVVIPDRIERMLLAMTADVEQDIAALKNGAMTEAADSAEQLRAYDKRRNILDSEASKLCERIDRVAEQTRGELLAEIDSFIMRMEADARTLSDVSPEDIKRYYSLFCIDTLQEVLQHCTVAFQERINEGADAPIETVAALYGSQVIGHTTQIPSISLRNQTWTKQDTAALFVEQASALVSPLFLLITPFTDFIAGTARKNEVALSTPELIEEIIGQYTSLKNAVLSSFSNACKAQTQELKKHITDHYSEMKIALDSEKEQFAMVSRQDDQYKQKILDRVATIEGVFDSMKQRFLSIRSDF